MQWVRPRRQRTTQFTGLQGRRPVTVELNPPHTGLALVRVVEEAKDPRVVSFERMLINRNVVELKCDSILGRRQLDAIPGAGLERKHGRPSAIRRLLDGVLGANPGLLVLGVGEPVNLDTFGTEKESQAAECRVDDGFPRLIEELIFDFIIAQATGG